MIKIKERESCMIECQLDTAVTFEYEDSVKKFPFTRTVFGKRPTGYKRS